MTKRPTTKQPVLIAHWSLVIGHLVIILTSMPYLPDFAAFRRHAEGKKLVPVYRRLVSDALTPVSACHKLDTGGSIALFESVIGGEQVGRFSFVLFEPFLQFKATRNQIDLLRDGQSRSYTAADPLDELRALLREL